jgi:hypothetical protein
MKNFTEINEGVLDIEGSIKAGDDKVKANELFNRLKTLQLYNCGKYNDPGDSCIGDTSVCFARQTKYGSQKDMFGHKLAIGDLVFVRKDLPIHESHLDYCYGIIIGKKVNDSGRECFEVACGILGGMRDLENRKIERKSMSDLTQMRDNFELTSDSVYKYASLLTIPGWNLIHIASKNKVDSALSKLK